MEAQPDNNEPIVVGVDGSRGAAHALDWALREAATRGVPLHVVHAWSPPAPITGIGVVLAEIEPEPYEQEAKEVLERAIDDAFERVGPSTLSTVPVLTRGYPPEVLLKAAEHAQLLVVGARGLGGFRELLLGSVSHACAHHSPVPVVIVPTPKEHRDEGPAAHR